MQRLIADDQLANELLDKFEIERQCQSEPALSADRLVEDGFMLVLSRFDMLNVTTII